jgi:hypothetical protein
VGFNYTLGAGGFTGFVRCQTSPSARRKKMTSGYCTSLDELALAPPKIDVHVEIREFLAQELENGFGRYIGLGERLDGFCADQMRPFIRSLP